MLRFAKIIEWAFCMQISYCDATALAQSVLHTIARSPCVRFDAASVLWHASTMIWSSQAYSGCCSSAILQESQQKLSMPRDLSELHNPFFGYTHLLYTPYRDYSGTVVYPRPSQNGWLQNTDNKDEVQLSAFECHLASVLTLSLLRAPRTPLPFTTVYPYKAEYWLLPCPMICARVRAMQRPECSV